MDDANVPSLLSLPYLGFLSKWASEDSTQRRTYYMGYRQKQPNVHQDKEVDSFSQESLLRQGQDILRYRVRI